LSNGKKAVKFTVCERKVFGARKQTTLHAMMFGNQLVIEDVMTLTRPILGSQKARIENYANVVTSRSTFAKVLKNGGTATVKSGYGQGNHVRGTWDQRYGTLKVEPKGSRVKITAPCGATVVMTRERVEKLVEAVKSL
jgi:hypothetical protein